MSDKDELIKYLKKNNLWAKKSLGQNFLVDGEVLGKIVESAELKATDMVLEIGPGLGILTEKLLDKAGRVVVVEKDQKFAELLKSKNLGTKKSRNKLEIVNADILNIDLKKQVPKVYKLVANIPYYITGQLFRKFLGAENKPKLIVLLVQREVAERVVARPGKMSLLSVSVQAFGHPEIIEIVKAKSFFPSPKVDSAILKVETVENRPGIANDKKFFRCVRSGFSSKRKTLANNLSAGYQLEKGIIEDIIASVGLKKNVRAQELSLDSWNKISKKIS